MTWPAKHVSVSIPRSPADVYAFAAEPTNMPRWAAGLSGSITKSGDVWIAESPMGRVKVRFTAPNKFGILDHDVTLPSGETVHNPLRVLPNGDGSEVVFTLYRRPGVSEADWERDATQVTKDLTALKTLLEAKPSR